MEDMTPCPVRDDEVFRRVWQRVMGGRSEESSPIRPDNPGDGDLSCECLEALMRQQGKGLPPECEHWEQETQTWPAESVQPVQDMSGCGSQEEPMMPEQSLREPQPDRWQSMMEPPVQGAMDGSGMDMPAPEPSVMEEAPSEGLPPENGPDRGNDLPRLWEEPQPADDRTARMRRHVMDALEGWQFYRHLAKRARGTDARTLNAMAAEQHKEARKLSAAYFLLTGLRYWPSELLRAPAIPSYWGALRTRHQTERRMENEFRMAADDWEDQEVLALYQALIEGCLRRCDQLRSLLEQGNT